MRSTRLLPSVAAATVALSAPVSVAAYGGPNADVGGPYDFCWTDGFTAATCCTPPGDTPPTGPHEGNPECWALPPYSFNRCCDGTWLAVEQNYGPKVVSILKEKVLEKRATRKSFQQPPPQQRHGRGQGKRSAAAVEVSASGEASDADQDKALHELPAEEVSEAESALEADLRKALADPNNRTISARDSALFLIVLLRRRQRFEEAEELMVKLPNVYGELTIDSTTGIWKGAAAEGYHMHDVALSRALVRLFSYGTFRRRFPLAFSEALEIAAGGGSSSGAGDEHDIERRDLEAAEDVQDTLNGSHGGKVAKKKKSSNALEYLCEELWAEERDPLVVDEQQLVVRDHKEAAGSSGGEKLEFGLTNEAIALNKTKRNRTKIRTIFDFGCGLGHYVRDLRAARAPDGRAFMAGGVDGNTDTVSLSQGRCMVSDLTQPLELGFQYDAVMSLEVAEHIQPGVPEEVFVRNLDRHARKVLIVSWAGEEQGGHGHVNGRSSEYVIRRFENLTAGDGDGFLANGRWSFDPWTTRMLREAATFSWFKETLHVFVRI